MSEPDDKSDNDREEYARWLQGYRDDKPEFIFLDDAAVAAVARNPNLVRRARDPRAGGGVSRLVGKALALMPDGSISVADATEAVERALASEDEP